MYKRNENPTIRFWTVLTAKFLGSFWMRFNRIFTVKLESVNFRMHVIFFFFFYIYIYNERLYLSYPILLVLGFGLDGVKKL